MTSVELVLWNWGGTPKTDGNIAGIYLYSFGVGYAIGSNQAVGNMLHTTWEWGDPDKDADAPALWCVGTEPEDFTEHIGTMVEPQSLFDDQLNRRMSTGTLNRPDKRNTALQQEIYPPDLPQLPERDHDGFSPPHLLF